MYNKLYNRKISAKKMQQNLKKVCLIIFLQMIMEVYKGGPYILNF